MKFSATTVYDEERVLRFNSFVVLKKRVFWSVMIACNILVAISVALCLVLEPQDRTVLGYAALVGFIDVAVAFCFFILPRFTLKKSFALNANVAFIFEEDVFKVFATMKNGTDSAEMNYSAIVKIMESKQDIYIFVSNNQSYILDKSGFNVGCAEEFLQFLKEKNIPYKK